MNYGQNMARRIKIAPLPSASFTHLTSLLKPHPESGGPTGDTEGTIANIQEVRHAYVKDLPLVFCSACTQSAVRRVYSAAADWRRNGAGRAAAQGYRSVLGDVPVFGLGVIVGTFRRAALRALGYAAARPDIRR